MATLSQLLTKLSPNDQLRGKQFEHICKWYLQNDPSTDYSSRRCGYGMSGPDAGLPMLA